MVASKVRFSIRSRCGRNSRPASLAARLRAVIGFFIRRHGTFPAHLRCNDMSGVLTMGDSLEAETRRKSRIYGPTGANAMPRLRLDPAPPPVCGGRAEARLQSPVSIHYVPIIPPVPQQSRIPSPGPPHSRAFIAELRIRSPSTRNMGELRLT
jgi:hypothetical protein